MSRAKHLCVFCRYAENGASSRLRFFRYRPFFEAAGIDVEYSSFFDAAYLDRLYAGRPRQPGSFCRAFFRRIRDVARCAPDAAFFIEYELFPLMPAWAEKAFFLKERPYFLGFDDPVWEKYAKLPGLSGKYDALARNSSGIIAANDLIMERFGKLDIPLLKVPTAIDLDRYDEAAGKAEKFPRFTVAWIGSPATFPFLRNFLPVLQKMASCCDFELLMIGKAFWGSLPGVPSRSVEWSEAEEAELLARCHAGIMPLPDEPFARGKSAYKLIQYAGAGLPALASPVGENTRVIVPGKTGFLCSSPEEWGKALETLIRDEGLRNAMGRNARERAEAWSLERHASRLIDFLFPEDAKRS